MSRNKFSAKAPDSENMAEQR